MFFLLKSSRYISPSFSGSQPKSIGKLVKVVESLTLYLEISYITYLFIQLQL